MIRWTSRVKPKGMQSILEYRVSRRRSLFYALVASEKKVPRYTNGKSIMVHLFEWKFNDVAEECEDSLGWAARVYA